MMLFGEISVAPVANPSGGGFLSVNKIRGKDTEALGG